MEYFFEVVDKDEDLSEEEFDTEDRDVEEVD